MNKQTLKLFFKACLWLAFKASKQERAIFWQNYREIRNKQK